MLSKIVCRFGSVILKISRALQIYMIEEFCPLPATHSDDVQIIKLTKNIINHQSKVNYHQLIM